MRFIRKMLEYLLITCAALFAIWANALLYERISDLHNEFLGARRAATAAHHSVQF